MSRRKVSVKELGQVDCHGWLHKKREGKGFLGIKWKKYWFVLKKTSLYWYTCETAEKAEGYINLADFTVDQARECKKKHAMKASHPHIVTFFLAAESLRDMNKWLAKLSIASTMTEPSEEISGECYSEASDQEEESMETPSPLYSEQLTTDSVNGDVPQNCCMSSPCPPPLAASPPAAMVTRESSKVLPTKQTESWLKAPPPGGPPSGPAPRLLVTQEDGAENTSDEMSRLFIHLREMRISPTGQFRPCSQRDFRVSFIRRCKNDKINDKLHLVRTLNSTLKAKEVDLLSIQQVLDDPTLTALSYRSWKVCNTLLMQEIIKCQSPPEGSRELPVRAHSEVCVDQTAVTTDKKGV
ncbi:interactor protein for cytohesin exchange factors 1 [Osmerus mordax]|uniref:interactor protein for cytohesin exchange factors 1 n=1 Tax=Osmerus mordax TaxID=8014 RepID=UPI00350F3450